jgi:peptidoglycan/xylan/chitin deacetylase (PgdA/CDA1 family)
VAVAGRHPDWLADGSGSSSWVQRIIRLAEAEGAKLAHPVVLMHNQPIGNPATVSALPTIIRSFRSHGYTFIALERHLRHRRRPGTWDGRCPRADGDL